MFEWMTDEDRAAHPEETRAAMAMLDAIGNGVRATVRGKVEDLIAAGESPTSAFRLAASWIMIDGFGPHILEQLGMPQRTAADVRARVHAAQNVQEEQRAARLARADAEGRVERHEGGATVVWPPGGRAASQQGAAAPARPRGRRAAAPAVDATAS